MVKTCGFIVPGFLFIFLFESINLASPPAKKSQQQQNNPPVVTIISPKNNSTFSPNTPIHFSITISDKEDGDSKYEEINPKEVLLEVKLLNDTSNISEIKRSIQPDSPGLLGLRTSNCFNCHSFDSKLIGPSFEQINKKYKPTAENITLLEKRIREGSTGVWGKASMPTHPELSDAQIENIVKWIFQNATTLNVNYYIGLEGSVLLKSPKNPYLLTASYTDHGINNSQRLKGQQSIVLIPK